MSDPHPIEDRIKVYMSKNPHVTVNIVKHDSKDYMRKLSKILSEDQKSVDERGKIPDLIELTPYQMRLLSKYQKIEDLTPYVQLEDPVSLNDIYDSLIRAMTIDNKILAMPIEANPLVVIFNKHSFQSAGIPFPQDGWTWYDFLDISIKLNGAGFKTSIPFDLDEMEAVVKGFGGMYASDDVSQATDYINSEKTLKAIDWLLKNKINGYPHDRRDFRNNDMGLVISTFHTKGYHSYIEYSKENENLGVATIPRGNDGTLGSMMKVFGLGLVSASEHKKEAWELLRYISLEETEISSKQAEARMLPTRRSIAELAGLNDHSVASVVIQEIERAERTTFQVHLEWSVDFETQYISNAGYRYLYEASPEDDLKIVLDQMAAEIDSELAKSSKLYEFE